MLFVKTKNFPDFFAQNLNIITITLLSKSPKIVKILPYLGRENFSYDEIDEIFAGCGDRAPELSAAEEKPLMEWNDGTKNPEDIICQTAAAMRGYPAEMVKEWSENLRSAIK